MPEYADILKDLDNNMRAITDRGPKESTGKRDWAKFPFTEAGYVVDVFEYGAQKYGAPFTYRAGIPKEELLSAIIRHAVAMLNGNCIDKESGCLHAACISANGLMLLSNVKVIKGDDEG